MFSNEQLEELRNYFVSKSEVVTRLPNPKSVVDGTVAYVNEIIAGVKVPVQYAMVNGVWNKRDYLPITGGTIEGDLEVDGDLEVTGDLIFTGAGSGLPFAEIYGHNTATSLVLTTLDQGYQVLAFAVNGQSNLATPDYTNAHITIANTGVYRVHYDIGLHSATSVDVSFSVKKNNGATDHENSDIHFDLAAGGSDVTAGTGCLIALTAGDTVELWAHRNNGGAVAKTIVIEHSSLNVNMVGG